MNIKIEEKAKQSLDIIKSKYKSDLKNIIESLKLLWQNWLKTSGIKNIWDNIYRKRVWRWRILFTINKKELIIWFIKIEKDTKKDYKLWKNYIIKKIRETNSLKK